MKRLLVARHAMAGLLLVMGPVFVSAHAQVADAEQLLACQEIESAEERLRCFDAALAGTPVEADMTSAEASDGEAPTELADQAVDQTSDTTKTEDELIAEFGASDLPTEADEEALKELRAVVTHYEETRSGRQVFTLDNGQVWRQISGDRRSLYIPRRRDEPLEVIIKPGALGSHKLRLTTAKRTIKVERIL